jgi:hypothetical protein
MLLHGVARCCQADAAAGDAAGNVRATVEPFEDVWHVADIFRPTGL